MQPSRLSRPPSPRQSQRLFKSLAPTGSPRIHVSQAALAGGNFPALGYLPAGQLTQIQAAAYNALLRLGQTPENAKRLAQTAPNDPHAAISWLEGMYAGAITFAVAANLLFGGPEDPLGDVATGIAYAVGGIVGAVAPGLFAPSAPPKSGVGRPQPAAHAVQRESTPQAEQLDEHGNPYTEALEDLPGAIKFGYNFGNKVGNFVNNLFGGDSGVSPSTSAAPEYQPPAPAPQFSDDGSTEEIPSVTGPNAQPWRGYAAGEPDYSTAPQPSDADYMPPPAPQPGDNYLLPNPEQPEFEIPDDSDLGRPLQVQPQLQRGGNVPQIVNQPSDCPQCDDIDRLIHQTDDQIKKEQAQGQGQESTQTGIDSELRSISYQLGQLQQQETRPPGQRDIDSELETKFNLRKKLLKLKEKAKKIAQKVCFCVTCDSEQAALYFFGGEGEGAGCTVTSQGDCDQVAQLGQTTLQPPAAAPALKRMYAAPPATINPAARYTGSPQTDPANRHYAFDAYGNPLSIYTPPAGGLIDPAIDPELAKALLAQFSPDELDNPGPDTPSFQEPGLQPSIYQAANEGFFAGEVDQESDDPRGGESQNQNPYAAGSGEYQAWMEAYPIGNPSVY